MPHQLTTIITQNFPGLEPQIRARMALAARELNIAQGSVIFSSGNEAGNFFILKSGSVKVVVTAEGGRQIVLYRVGAGQSCVLTTACLMSGEHYNADAMAETECEALLIPKSAFHELLAASANFRQLVFAAFGQRLHDLIALIEEIMNCHIDKRLAKLLANATPQLEATQQDIASELGTVREVVSRLLKDFELRGWINVSRGKIAIMSRAELLKYSGQT